MHDRMDVTEMGRKSPNEAGLVTLGTGVKQTWSSLWKVNKISHLNNLFVAAAVFL